MPEVRPLDDGETLTFLHGAISDRRHRVAAPATPMYLDGLLADTPLVGGLEPRLGELHVRTLTVLGFPRSEEHTSELQPLMRISYAVFCLKKKKNTTHNHRRSTNHHL